MNISQIIIVIAFFASLGATVLYFLNGKKKYQQLLPIAARLYDIGTVLGIVASFAMLYYLFTHQFQYDYVVKYSSLDQPMEYQISALWAGQEGTFLLWVMIVGIMGWVLRVKTKAEDAISMGVVSAFSAFLFLLMIVKSPFTLSAQIPADGQGMNPLLTNIWMVIHPPILFVGYAATVFPFALAISGLVRRNYNLWIDQGFAWVLFACVTLGAGIIIGGFWAYETLGWGGYWGWDPVENSSLVPWLALLALIHGLIVFKTKGALARTNIFLAILSFLLVLYATYLTRSGVLSDFSVHAFVDLGINTYLMSVLILSTVVSLGIFFMRFKEIHSPKISIKTLNREVTLLLSIYVLMAMAAFTFAGMSSPIITGFFGKASQVDISFYNEVNLPVAIIMSLLLGITPFLGWTEEVKSSLIKRYSMPLILTVLSTVIAYVAGVTSPVMLLFVGSAAFALISNSVVAFRQYRSGWMTLGGPITHIGTALLLIGIVGSGKFDETKQIILEQGKPQDIFGYSILFKGILESPNEKPIVDLEVHDGKNVFEAKPRLYFSNYSQSLMREPDVKIFPLKDLYLSPLEVKAREQAHQTEGLELIKGEEKEYGGYKIKFNGFETGEHGQPGAMLVGAGLTVTVDGKSQEIKPAISINPQGEQSQMPAEMPLLQSAPAGTPVPLVALSAMSVEEKKIFLEFQGVGDHNHVHDSGVNLLLEVSIKPLMMVVWTGVMLIIAGTFVAFLRRTLQKGVAQS